LARKRRRDDKLLRDFAAWRRTLPLDVVRCPSVSWAEFNALSAKLRARMDARLAANTNVDTRSGRAEYMALRFENLTIGSN
jgi:hypothetical protein